MADADAPVIRCESVPMTGQHCIECGVLFAISTEFDGYLWASKQTFYCPNGHAQTYRGRPAAGFR